MSGRKSASGPSNGVGVRTRSHDDVRELMRQIEGLRCEISFKDKLITRLRGMLGESSDEELVRYQQSRRHKALVREWGRAYARAAVMVCKSQIGNVEASKIDASWISDEVDREIGALIEKVVMKGLGELGWDCAPPSSSELLFLRWGRVKIQAMVGWLSWEPCLRNNYHYFGMIYNGHPEDLVLGIIIVLVCL